MTYQCLSAESAKLRALRAKKMLTCQRALRAYVPMCPARLPAYVPTCPAYLPAQVPTCFACLGEHVTTCLDRLFVTL